MIIMTIMMRIIMSTASPSKRALASQVGGYLGHQVDTTSQMGTLRLERLNDPIQVAQPESARAGILS